MSKPVLHKVLHLSNEVEFDQAEGTASRQRSPMLVNSVARGPTHILNIRGSYVRE